MRKPRGDCYSFITLCDGTGSQSKAYKHVLFRKRKCKKSQAICCRTGQLSSAQLRVCAPGHTDKSKRHLSHGRANVAKQLKHVIAKEIH